MKRPDECPVCGSSNINCRGVQNADIYAIECHRCGSFKISEEAAHDLTRAFSTDRQRANASGWVSENNGILIRLAEIDSLLALPTPGVAERADKLLLAVERRQKGIGGALAVRYDGTRDSAGWLSASWSTDGHEVRYLAEIEKIAMLYGHRLRASMPETQKVAALRTLHGLKPDAREAYVRQL